MTPYESDSKLVSFFYTLLRDELPAGVVEKLVQDAALGEKITYTNGHLAEYAASLAKRLTEEGYAYDVFVRGAGPYRVTSSKFGITAREVMQLALATYGLRPYERHLEWEMTDAKGQLMLGPGAPPLSEFNLPFHVSLKPGYGG